MSLELDHFTLAYIEAGLWSSQDNDDEPLDSRFSVDDISSDTLMQMVKDCAEFQAACSHFFEMRFYKGRNPSGSVTEYAGHDFWLTRNGHGAGFWDGDWKSEAESLLDRTSKQFGEYSLYVGDDGQIHGMKG